LNMKIKHYIRAAAVLVAAAVFITCSKDNNASGGVEIPAKAVVTGASANECPATSVDLTASASGAQSYEWYRNALVIGGATAAVYTAISSGTYHAVGVNPAGKGAKSDDKEVTVTLNCPPPTPQLSGYTDNQCPTLTVRLTATAENVETYIWYRNGTKIEGVTTAYYEVTESGVYAVAVRNAYGTSEKSEERAVTISPCPPAAPVISGSTVNVCPATSVVLTAASEGATAYQWYRYAEAIPGATASTYEATVTGGYYATASNAAGASEKTANAYIVYIDLCAANFNYTDLLGAYNVSGTPCMWGPPDPGPSAWTTTVSASGTVANSEYEIKPFAGAWADNEETGILPIYLEVGTSSDGGGKVAFAIDTRRALGTETVTSGTPATTKTYTAYFQAFFTTTVGSVRYIHWLPLPDDYYQAFWDPATKTLDLSGVYTWDTGEGNDGKDHDIIVAIVAFTDINDKKWEGSFSDGYANCRFVQTGAAGAPAAFTGERVSLPRPSTLRTASENIQSRTIKFDPAKLKRKR
jgi:hypothetical protein